MINRPLLENGEPKYLNDRFSSNHQTKKDSFREPIYMF